MYDTLVLSGGGSKGFCLLGAVQATIDLGLASNLRNYIGTSIGAIIGYLLAIGYTPIEIMVELSKHKWLERMQYFNVISVTNGNGALNFNNLSEALEKLTLDKIGRLLTLKNLRELFGKTLICVTYNTTRCETEYLSPDTHPELPCLIALKMSANIPIVFDRFKYTDCFYIDGGITDNFPILKGEEIGENVLGIYLDINEKSLADKPEEGIITYFLKLLYTPIIQSTKFKTTRVSSKCKIIPVRTEQLHSGIEFNIHSKMRLDMFSCGYSAVKENIQESSKSNVPV